MECSISSLAYQGSIPEAITEAKKQKKLFVVYISGDNVDSTRLEESTWTDPKVAESVSKYCILLHIQEGSADATNFSAISITDSQRPAPCITAVGYNGIQLWQIGGFVNAEVLISSLEKAWLGLHVQETTTTFLTAALASKKNESFGTNTSTTSFEQGSSSSMVSPASLINDQAQSFQASTVASSEMENKAPVHANKDVDSKPGDEASSNSAKPTVPEHFENEQTISLTERAEESLNLMKPDQNVSAVAHMPSGNIDKGAVPVGNAVDCYLEVAIEALQDEKAKVVNDDKIDSVIPSETSQVVTNKAMQSVQDKVSNIVDDTKTDVLESGSSQSSDVYVNIRLLDGASLQEKFLLTSTLRMIKDYVDENQESSMGPYDLAIPYPRKVFDDQDLNKQLSELGLHGRQTLVMVPRSGATGYNRGGSSSSHQINSTPGLDASTGSNEGYFSSVRRILSYVNPLSYLGSGANSSNPAPESQGSMWQYSPNPTLQNNLRGRGTSHGFNSPNQSTSSSAGGNNRSGSSSNRQRTSSGFGSNIHTLKHDEDDGRFTGRNAFWNGNSTEYGGDNDGK
ncbi:hypothetical protein NMG60_11028260 [Bertholletia excelsa]